MLNDLFLQEKENYVIMSLTVTLEYHKRHYPLYHLQPIFIFSLKNEVKNKVNSV